MDSLLGETSRKNSKTAEGRILKKLYVWYANEGKAAISSILTKDEEHLISFLGDNRLISKNEKPVDMESDEISESNDDQVEVTMEWTAAFKLKERAENDIHIFDDQEDDYKIAESYTYFIEPV